MNEAPVRVAVLITATEFGGAERVVLSLLDHMDPKKYELVPIIFTRREVVAAPFVVDFTRGRSHYIVVANDFRIKYLNPLVNMLQTVRLIKKSRCVLIHAHGYRATFLGLASAKLLGLPFLATCHGYIATDRALCLYNSVDRRVLRLADAVIVVSKEIREALMRSGMKSSSIQVIPNAVGAVAPRAGRSSLAAAVRHSCGFSDSDFVVGFLGRLSEEKGVRHLIGALQLSSGKKPLKAIVVGDGPQRKELERLSETLNVRERVHFAGFQADIEPWLGSFDVFVLPSLSEGTPMALLEAMAHGVPVVATRVGGVPDIIVSKKNGLLVSPGNPSELKDALELLCSDGALRDAMAQAAVKTVSLRYGVGEWIKRHEELYRTLVSGEKLVA